MPLDDEAALDASKPVTPDGQVQFDEAKVRARHEAQVRLALKGGRASLLILRR